MTVLNVALPSAQSLLVRTYSGTTELGKGTAFVVRYLRRNFLVTNWHIVAGRKPFDRQPCSKTLLTPDRMSVLHNATGSRNPAWQAHTYELRTDDGLPIWFEHGMFGPRVDVVAIRLPELEGAAFYPYSLDPSTDDDLLALVATGVSIIGFPFGEVSAGGLAIWSKGWVATDPDLSYRNLPCFLIDSRTRSGQSGSPVILFSEGTHRTASRVIMDMSVRTRLLGVYSGRISDDSDLGYVWKTTAIREILTQGVRGNGDLVDPRHTVTTRPS